MGGLSVLGGLAFTIRSMWRIWKERRAAITLGLRGETPEWVIIKEKVITATIVGFGQLVMLVAIVLVLRFDSPRPTVVQEIITWSIVAMPVILGLLSFHSEIAYHREMQVLVSRTDGLRSYPAAALIGELRRRGILELKEQT